MTHMNSLSPSQSRHNIINIISNGSDYCSNESLTRKNSLVSPLDWDNHNNTEFHMEWNKLHQNTHSSSASLNRNVSDSSEPDTKAIAKANAMDHDDDQNDDDDDDDDDSFEFTDEENDDELTDFKRKKFDRFGKKKGVNMLPNSNLNMMDSKAKEKNRYHAKNTRMRKKNLIDAMRDKVISLSGSFQATQIERKHRIHALSERVNLQKNHLLTFFRLRAAGEQSHHLWSEILDSNFVFTLPITPYRSFPPHQVLDNQRYIVGIDAIISDTTSLFVMLQSLGDQRENTSGFIQAEYILDWNNMVIDGATLMSKWSLHTTNATSKGARHEVFKQGMIQVLFSPNNNKILSINMSHDVMSFMQELRRCSGSYDFQLIPNTFNIACEDSSEMRLIVESSEEDVLLSKIAFVNNAFSDTFGSVQLKGQSFKGICHGDKQNLEAITRCIQSAVTQCTVIDTISLYNDEGTTIVSKAKFFPLYKINQASNSDESSKISHVLIVMEPLTQKGTAGAARVGASMIVTEEVQSTNSNVTDTSQSLMENKLEKKNGHRTSRLTTKL